MSSEANRQPGEARSAQLFSGTSPQQQHASENDRLRELQQLFEQGCAVAGSGEHGAAQTMFQSLIDRLQEIPDSPGERKTLLLAAAHARRGACALAQGKRTPAKKDLKRAVELFQQANYAMDDRFRGEYARALESLGRYAEAIKVLEACSSRSEHTIKIAELLSIQAQEYAGDGQIKAAAEAYRNAASKYNDSQDYARAFEYFRKAAELQPESAYHLASAADMLMRLKRFDEAVELYAQAVDLGPDQAFLWRFLGRAYQHQGNIDHALKSIDRALKLDESSGAAMKTKIDILRAAGRREEALQLVDTSIASFSDNEDLLNDLRERRMQILCDLGRPEEAITAAQTLIDTWREDQPPGEAWKIIAACSQQLGQYPEALEAYNQALQIDPTNLSLLRDKAETIRLDDRPEEALRILNQVLSHAPDDAQALRFKVYALIDQQDYQVAREVVQRALDGRPDDGLLLAASAYIYKRREQYREAWDEVRRARQALPTHPYVLGLYAAIANRIAEHQAALDALDPIEQPSVETWLKRGWAHQQLSQWQQAREAYQQALRSADYPDTVYAYAGLGDVQQRLGDRSAAEKAYTAAIQEATARTAVTPQLFADIGWCQFQLTHYDEAIRLYNEALALSPYYYSTQFNLGLALLCRRNIALALERYRRTTEQVHKECDPLLRRSLLLVARADLDEALRGQADLIDDPNVQQIRDRMDAAYAETCKEAAAILGAAGA